MLGQKSWGVVIMMASGRLLLRLLLLETLVTHSTAALTVSMYPVRSRRIIMVVHTFQGQHDGKRCVKHGLVIVNVISACTPSTRHNGVMHTLVQCGCPNPFGTAGGNANAEQLAWPLLSPPHSALHHVAHISK
jgi:hypothetical protein